jgi:hypothetical protein
MKMKNNEKTFFQRTKIQTTHSKHEQQQQLQLSEATTAAATAISSASLLFSSFKQYLLLL